MSGVLLKLGHYLPRSVMGHEDAFPRPRLSARCRFSQRSFEGTWGNYPFFKSGIVAVSSMTEGLFILKKHPTPPVP